MKIKFAQVIQLEHLDNLPQIYFNSKQFFNNFIVSWLYKILYLVMTILYMCTIRFYHNHIHTHTNTHTPSHTHLALLSLVNNHVHDVFYWIISADAFFQDHKLGRVNLLNIKVSPIFMSYQMGKVFLTGEASLQSAPEDVKKKIYECGEGCTFLYGGK